jgi:hypothetical protein
LVENELMQECYRKDKHPFYSLVADVATISFCGE